MSSSRSLLLLVMLAGVCVGGPLRLYVSPSGDDSLSGLAPRRSGANGPFATLQRARDVIRELKKKGRYPEEGVVIEVESGRYEIAEPIRFTSEDSGLPGAPVVYKACVTGGARLTGTRLVRGFKPLRDSSLLLRLPPEVRGKVLVADLRASGVSDWTSAPLGKFQLFFDDEPMVLARWPNDKFVRIVKTADEKPFEVRGRKGDRSGKFYYSGDRPRRWVDEKDPYVHGCWYWDWSDGRQRIAAIDPERKLITLAPPYHGYGYRAGQWYYAYNLFCEIDQPGEWYVDREEGLLYFLPPGPVTSGNVAVSVAPGILHVEKASHLVFRGLVFEGAQGTGVVLDECSDVTLSACVIRNCGGGGIAISSGRKNRVVGCDIYNLGYGGVSLRGGNRRTLQPARHTAENNHIYRYGRWKWMYSAGISIGGVGNVVSHNLIHSAPHQAVAFSGNDHVIEYNEIHSVCLLSNDAGAIYSGRNWTMRGTVIRYNYLHDIGGFRGGRCVGVYLDDMYCGTRIEGNLFVRVTRAAFIGGGRDNVVVNNLFVDCDPALHVDARAMGWAKGHTDQWVKEARERGLHRGIPFMKPPYSTRYPGLADILKNNPWAPAGNLIARNICVGGRWEEIEKKTRPFLRMEKNLVSVEVGLVSPEKGDYRLRKDSPAFKIGFRPLPIDKMGLYRSPDRASWPVKHKVEKPCRNPFLSAR